MLGAGIFKNKEVWSEEYIPENILFRNEQIERLNFYLNPVLGQGRGSNILVLGDYGTGKTATVSHVCRKIEAKAISAGYKVAVFWANASKYTDTRQSVSCNRLFANWLNSIGVKTYHTMPAESIIDLMEKKTRELDACIFVIDEVDEYLSNPRNDFNRFGYLISRSFHNANAIMITNKFWVASHLNDELDPRVVDTFTRNLRTLSFSDYIEDELRQILGDRAKVGLNDDVYNNELLNHITRVSYHQGWKARGVISLTSWAGELAEREGYGIIEPWMIDHVAKTKPEQEMENIVATLDPPMLNILHFLVQLKKNENREWAKEADVLTWFQSKEKNLHLLTGTSKTTFWIATGKLRGMGIIEREFVGRGRAMGTYGRMRIMPQYIPIVMSVLGGVDEKEEVDDDALKIINATRNGKKD